MAKCRSGFSRCMGVVRKHVIEKISVRLGFSKNKLTYSDHSIQLFNSRANLNSLLVLLVFV